MRGSDTPHKNIQKSGDSPTKFCIPASPKCMNLCQALLRAGRPLFPNVSHPVSPTVPWTHVLLIVLHRAPHKGNDAHLVILALSVLQSQLVKKGISQSQPEESLSSFLCHSVVFFSYGSHLPQGYCHAHTRSKPFP